ncbi:hypothetical protein FPL11_06265 [Spiribacter aquaticus]|uniref:Uncharacterized protein n=1 Tax=Spiribacter aquaticus TaxID=1935996 RepID=A0A557RKH3_9GAMM|nr:MULTISPECIES: hypothetical protein [Spiribacter]KAF0279817.1 hypothetical protein BA897_03490 [Spiribacter roseus]TVO65661.1 hypothetical protein FPL11_06265 [Spiribacter aquaticus]
MAYRKEYLTGELNRQSTPPASAFGTDRPIPFPALRVAGHPRDGDRLGVRERLRREATSALVIEAELKADGLALIERIKALQLPWLDALFHSPESVHTFLNAHGLSAPDAQRMTTTHRELSTPAIDSEVALMEAIQQRLRVLRLIRTRAAPHGLCGQRREKRWSQLLSWLALWETTLRA